MLGGRSSSSQRFYLIARWQTGNATDLGAIPVDGECELATGEMQPPAMDRPAYVAGTLAVGEDSFDVIESRRVRRRLFLRNAQSARRGVAIMNAPANLPRGPV